MFFLLGFLLAAPASAAQLTVGLSAALPEVTSSRVSTSGVNCLRSILSYWGGPVPGEVALGFHVLELAREILGDEEFVRQGREDLSQPLNHPQALAQAARERGLAAVVEERRPLRAFLVYLERGETVIVPQVYQGQLHSGVVCAVRNGQICLMKPVAGRVVYDWVPLPIFERYWFNVGPYPGTLVRIFPGAVLSP